MAHNIEGKVVVITGASSGLGEAAARHLAAQGAKVVLGARRADRLEALVGEILSPGAVKTELLDHISEDSVRSANIDYVSKVGISADRFASIVAFAISQPEDVDVNEIIFRPTAQQL